MSLDANELLEKLAERDITPSNLQNNANSLAGGYETVTLYGSASGVDLIAEQLIPNLPEAAASMALDEQKFDALSLTSENNKIEPS